VIYRVHEGEIIWWPDGSIRATDGQTFDGYDTNGTPASREWAQAILGRQLPRCYTLEDDQEVAPDVTRVPDTIRDQLAALAGGDFEAVKSVVAKKKVTKKKATKKARPERLGDPEE
jgi:hypothetical protein